MKKNLFVWAMVAIAGLLSACKSDDPWENRVKGATYTYNYYWCNALDESVTIKFERLVSHKKDDTTIEKQFALAPNAKVLVEQLSTTAWTEKGNEANMPVYTPSDSQPYIWTQGIRMEGEQLWFSVQRGDSAAVEYDVTQNKEIFFVDNYTVETVNDTTFNFYFTIDEAYYQGLK